MCAYAAGCGRALERAATSIPGPRAARALAGGAERPEPTSSRIILRLSRLSAAVLAVRWVDRVPLPLGARQGQLDLTACDRRGTRRLGAAGRGGTAQARPRAVSACPTRATRPARSRQGVPCHPLHRRASSTSPPAIGGDRVASAGRCGAVRACRAGPSRVAEALRQGRSRAAQAAHVPRAAAPPTARWHGPAGADEQPARRPASVERVAHRDGAAASPTAAGTARRRPEPERPRRDRALSVSLRGEIKRSEKRTAARRRKNDAQAAL